MTIKAIVAVGKNGVIGKDGKIPWNSKEDMAHFRETTRGCCMIMGRKTFESLPDNFNLDGRNLIVMSKNSTTLKSNLECIVVDNILSAILQAYSLNDSIGDEDADIFVIGGSKVYREALHHVEEIILTEMKYDGEGDTYFPTLYAAEWVVDIWNRLPSGEPVNYIRRVEIQEKLFDWT